MSRPDRVGGSTHTDSATATEQRAVLARAHQVLSLTNVAARGVLEASIVAALAGWGYATGDSALTRGVLAVLAPAIVFGFWGAVDFRFAGRHAEWLRLVQELAVSVLASLALYSVQHHELAWLLATLSIAHHVAVYLLGERLLKETP